MDLGAPEIMKLRKSVQAAQDEMQIAIAFHEVWKPTVSDSELQARLGRSQASHTFIVIRTALRREAMLALMRLWDSDKKAVGLSSISNKLKDRRIIAVFSRECEQARSVYLGGSGKTTPEYRKALATALAEIDAREGSREGSLRRATIAEVVRLISRYEPGGDRHEVLCRMRMLRDERLAHRQIEPTEAEPERLTEIDLEMESFYGDMLDIVRLLRLAVDRHNIDFNDAAKLHAYPAKLFWASVKGERTDGHPFYESLPQH